MQRIYFDNGATTKVDPMVSEVMSRYFHDSYGNASSLHSFGQEASEAIEEARETVARGVGASPAEMIFTSGGTESDNLALQGFAFANRDKGNHIITSAVEHHAVLYACRFLETQGFKVTYLPVDGQGSVMAKNLQEAMTKDTILVSIMAANSEVGTIQDFREFGKIAHDHGAAFHTDAVQYITKHPLDVDRDNIDMCAMSGHKFHGPKGVGGMYLRQGMKIRPLVYGGGQEQGLRSATENVPGIVGMAKAFDLAVSKMDQHANGMIAVRDRIIEDVLRTIEGAHLNGPRTARLCNNAHFRFDHLEGESLLLRLDAKGIAVSTGSACSSRGGGPSHVLTAMGIRSEDTHGSMRLTFSRFSTIEEADHFLKVLPDEVRKLREISPTYRGA